MSKGVARISISLPPGLLAELDDVSRSMGYEERSKALQMAIRNLITEHQLTKDDDSFAMGTILVLYNHEKRGVEEKLTHIGHHFSKLIISSLHVHLDEEQCLSIIVAKGAIKSILSLEQHLRKISGITQLKFSYMVPGSAEAEPPRHHI